MGLSTSNQVISPWLLIVNTKIITTQESWSDLVAGWAPWYHCLQYQKWRLESTPSGSLGFFVITSRILEWWASGTRMCCKFWLWFLKLICNVSHEYCTEGIQTVRRNCLAVEFLRVFPELRLRLYFVVQFPISSMDGLRVISYMPLHWICQISVLPSKDKNNCLYEVEANSSGGGESLQRNTLPH